MTLKKREQYDNFGSSAFQAGGGFQDINDIFSSFGDIFGDIFGSSSRRRSQKRGGPIKGEDLQYTLDIPFDVVMSGAEREIRFDTESDCKDCRGTGAADSKNGIETCRECRGQGQVVQSRGFFSMASTCGACGGRGQVVRHPCGSCLGRGRKREKRKIQVKVPPGVDTGVQLRIGGAGAGGHRGGPTGDLFVQIYVNKEVGFQREGRDLYGQVKISYLQALLGTEKSVKTWDGKKNTQYCAWHATRTGVAPSRFRYTQLAKQK